MRAQPLHPPSEPSQDGTPPQPDPPVWGWGGWSPEPFATREVRKAQQRAERAARRADRAARRLHEAQERSAERRSGARQLVDVAGDAATAALTAVSAAADEAQARLAAKARMRELEHAVVIARAGGPVDVTPPTRDEAMKLVRRMDPASSGPTIVRGVGFIIAGIAALVMTMVGGFGWLGFVVPLVILIASGSTADRIRMADRSRKADHIQLELARASLGATERAPGAGIAQDAPRERTTSAPGAPATTARAAAERPSLIENGDPRTRAEILAVLDRLVANVVGRVPDTELATLRRIRDSAARAFPATDGPLDLTDHDIWLLRQMCIDYVPGALDHYLVLRSDLASEPLLDGRSARQVLDDQLALIETRLDELGTRAFRRQAGGLLSHARFVADSLRPDPFEAWLAEPVTNAAEQASVDREPAHSGETTVTIDEAAIREREHA